MDGANDLFYMSVNITPVPKGRPRFSRKVGSYKTKKTRAYTPKKTKEYEISVALQAKQRMGGRTAFEAPIDVEIVFHMPIPKSFPKWRREGALNGRIAPSVKPDIDNLSKAVLDAINGIVYMDDSLIVSLKVKKIYGDRHGFDVGVRHSQNGEALRSNVTRPHYKSSVAYFGELNDIAQ